MITVTPSIRIDEKEIHEDFIHASGPGGQNVNKVATAVQLRFNVKESPSLPDDVRQRLVRLGGRRINKEGVLIIDARRFRNREKNRKDALARLVRLIRAAAGKPRPRLKTKPTRGSHIRRLDGKKRRGTVKRLRRPVSRFED